MSTEAGNWLVTLACAELCLVLVRYREINILAKTRSQRTPAERRELRRGLTRALVLELLVFVPVSVILAWFAIRPWFMKLSVVRWSSDWSPYLSDAWLGVISYVFPFATIRWVVTRVALNALSRFGARGTGPNNRAMGGKVGSTQRPGKSNGAPK